MRAIVVGLGIMGAAAAHRLAARGWSVKAFDAHHRGHTLGASHGHTRIIRQAYFEDPDYVPLLRRSYELWAELQTEVSEPLVNYHGALFIGPENSEVVTGSRRSALEHGIAHDYVSGAEVVQRWPQYRVPEEYFAVYEPNAGTLTADRCLEAELDMASRHGADLSFGTAVRSWSARESGVTVQTDSGEFEADRLVITAGPWAMKVLADLNLPMHVRRMVVCHFEPIDADRFKPDAMPVYCVEDEGKFFYGFPNLPGQGMKVGRHDIGDTVDPDAVDRTIHTEEIEERRQFLDKFLPQAAGSYLFGATCLYGMTPDWNFIIDRHPQHDNVSFGCGFSGHGFKFGPVIGEILADLATEGKTRHPIDFLSLAHCYQTKTP